MVKRLFAYLLNKLICSVLIYVLFMILSPTLEARFGYGGIYTDFMTMLGYMCLTPSLILLSLGFYLLMFSPYGLIVDEPSAFIVAFVLAMLLFSLVDFLLSLIFRVDIGSKIFKYELSVPEDKRVGIFRIFIRTVLKYFSLAIFPPILLFAKFHPDNIFFHEWASGAYKDSLFI